MGLYHILWDVGFQNAACVGVVGKLQRAPENKIIVKTKKQLAELMQY